MTAISCSVRRAAALENKVTLSGPGLNDNALCSMMDLIVSAGALATQLRFFGLVQLSRVARAFQEATEFV